MEAIEYQALTGFRGRASDAYREHLQRVLGVKVRQELIDLVHSEIRNGTWNRDIGKPWEE
jgi:hypothetical protein